MGISVTVDTLPRAAAIAERFRKQGIPVVAGGIHITTASHMIPEDTFDVLCIGAAEGTWHDIVQDCADGCLQKVYRCKKPLTGRASEHQPNERVRVDALVQAAEVYRRAFQKCVVET